MIHNDALAGLAWRKSSFSGGGGNGGAECVESAALPDGRFAVRDSKNPGAGALIFTRAGMSSFIALRTR